MSDLDDDLVDQLEQLGAVIRRARIIRGLSQRALESHSGVDQTMISRVERGQAPGIRLERIAAILVALHADIALVQPRRPPPAS